MTKLLWVNTKLYYYLRPRIVRLAHGAVLTNRGDIFGFGKKLIGSCSSAGGQFFRCATPTPAVSVACGGNVTLYVDGRRRLYQLGLPHATAISGGGSSSSNTLTGVTTACQNLSLTGADQAIPAPANHTRIRGVYGVSQVACGRKHTIILGN